MVHPAITDSWKYRDANVTWLPNQKSKQTYRVYLDFALGLEQQPSDGHAHEVRSESRPRFVVDLVEQRQRVVDAVEKRIFW